MQSNETNNKQPDYRIVRYYSDTKNAPSAVIGAAWQTEKGLSIVINGLEAQIRLMAFSVDERTA